MKNIILVLISFLFILSCSPGIYNEIVRPIADPEISLPSVDSFSANGIVEISWELDNLADEFILYRASDSAVLVFKEIYRGRDLTFVDTTGVLDSIYLYSLSKVRGDHVFEMSVPVAGLFTGNMGDSLENNNTEEESTLLNSEFIANLYDYQSIGGLEIADVDCYRIVLPGLDSVSITISQLNSGLVLGIDTSFLYTIDNSAVSVVLHNTEINLTNSMGTEKEFFIKLYPDQDDFLPVAGTAGGSFISYKISLIE